MKHPRAAGVTIPLFSIRTRRDWGIGQISDLPACAAFFRRAGHRLLQILPPHELSDGETSPYGALTAFGLDPIYIGIESVPDLDAPAIDEALGPSGLQTLAQARAGARVDYRAVRALKARALRKAYERFAARELGRTARGKALDAFIQAERDWLDDLALYNVLREERSGWGWETWPEPLRERSPSAMEEVRRRAADRLTEFAYVQWLALEQWEAARSEMRQLGVELMGDLPFVVCSESADVWARASQFQRHLSLGAPPDAFAPEGQDWGLPPYGWLAMESDDLAWVRSRSRHAARLYDRFRLDHVVGYFRQWVKERQPGAHGRFDPDGPDAQRARGRRVLGAMMEEAGDAQIVAEDLGVIPPFVRETLRELVLPGYRVIPWEKDEWRFRDPAAFPKVSVATWSTHDTAPITGWWADFTSDERAQLAQRAAIPRDASEDERSLCLLRLLFRSSSDLALVLPQELLGERDRINTPGTVGDENWTYRLPRPIEDLEGDRWVASRFDTVRRIVEDSGR